MKFKWSLVFIVFFLSSALRLMAQQNELNGWLFLLHKQKLASKVNLLTDLQVRSAADLKYVATLLSRTAVSYQFHKQHAAGLGYAYIADWKEGNGKKTYSDENRIFEQYLLDFKTHKIDWMGRFRLEQRFTGPKHQRKFSQRARFFMNALIPLVKGPTFPKGPYILLQNEIFVNIQNKKTTNNHFFDQNRLYGGLGYKYSKKLKTELGYMYRRKENEFDYVNNHIMQVTISTSL